MTDEETLWGERTVSSPRDLLGRRVVPAMDEPTFDAQGYPTDETLDRIRRWPINATADYEAVMDFAGRAWKYPDWWEKEHGYLDPQWGGTSLRYVFSTGGWSGNESIVHAIEQNQIVQMVGAWSWRRGGHYEYRFPEV